ncbi:UDP-N-acetylmuramoyl-tripeptide--D-alanyl-D-alanine ligase [Bacteroidota bacterium]
MPIQKVTIEDLFNMPTAVIYNPDGYKPARYVSIDSRNIKKNSIFFAIKGDNFDGHVFVKEAVKKGAAAVVINRRKLKNFDSIRIPIITVDDTAKAYGDLAKTWREKLNAKVVSLTGSNGKTTTKEILATLLSEKYKVVKTEDNNNNHIGVPLTIFSANEKTEVLVLEHGTNHFNEIEYTAKIARPDFAFITNIGNAHLEFLKSKEGVFNEKSSLLNETDLCGGKALINVDDPLLRGAGKNFKNRVTFGFTRNPDVKGEILGYTIDGRTKISIKNGHKNLETVLPIYGASNATNFLPAYVVAIKLGMTKKEINTAVNKLAGLNGRLKVIKKRKMILIDDTYNSSPESVKSGIDLVRNIKLHDRKILILGDMFELGFKSKKLHESLSDFISKNEISDVYLIGKYMKHLNSKLIKSQVNSRHCGTRKSLKDLLMKNNFEDSVVLVKGSRGMHMEDFLQIIANKAK